MAKFGMRKPSVKKSFSARTTGKMKRKVKSSVNPLYGKKGTGFIKNPKKATYNKVYNKTTYDSLSPLKNRSSKGRKVSTGNNNSLGCLAILAIVLVVGIVIAVLPYVLFVAAILGAIIIIGKVK